MRVVLFEQSFKDETTPNIAVYSFITYYEILLYFSFSPQFIQIMNNISKSYTIDSCDMLAWELSPFPGMNFVWSLFT